MLFLLIFFSGLVVLSFMAGYRARAAVSRARHLHYVRRNRAPRRAFSARSVHA